MNGKRDPGGEQAGRGEEGDRRHAHHLERVDLVGDPHRAELGDDPGPDLGRQHVAEGVGHDLAQVAPGGEDAGVGGGALGAQQVGALDPALQAEDEDRPQMISAEPRIRIPAWRRLSPKKRRTRPE